MRLFKIYESYDKAAFEDFKYHAAELFPKYWDTLYNKFYEDITYEKMQPRKVERNKMKAEGDKMLAFMAEHIKQRCKGGEPKLNKIAHITEDARIFIMMWDNFNGISFQKLQDRYKYSYGMIFRWFKKIDTLALEDDDVAWIVLSAFITAKE